jgi:hypothetical protein
MVVEIVDVTLHCSTRRDHVEQNQKNCEHCKNYPFDHICHFHRIYYEGDVVNDVDVIVVDFVDFVGLVNVDDVVDVVKIF